MLQKLPPELLFYVIGYLEPKFFQTDVRRLTVSKNWYAVAYPFFASNLNLTTDSLVKVANDEAAIARVEPYITTVTLLLDEVALFGSLRGPGYERGESDEARINSSLSSVAARLQQCSRLRSLKLKARTFYQPVMLPTQLLHLQPLADLLSLRFLTSLDLDTVVSCRLDRPEDVNVHICSSINSLLPTLRKLRCRMDYVCQDLLKIPSNTTSLPLEELILNVSLYGFIVDPRQAYSQPCASTRPFTYRRHTKLLGALQAQACELAKASNARTVRILAHRGKCAGLFAFEAVSGAHLWLGPDPAWDSVGTMSVNGTLPSNSRSENSSETD